MTQRVSPQDLELIAALKYERDVMSAQARDFALRSRELYDKARELTNKKIAEKFEVSKQFVEKIAPLPMSS